jgi:chromosomal replication initiation ATPase DnaA
LKRRPEVVVAALRVRGLGYLLDQVAFSRHLTPEEVVGNRKFAPHVAARAELVQRLRSELGWSYPAIACVLGREHTGVRHLAKTTTTPTVAKGAA